MTENSFRDLETQWPEQEVGVGGRQTSQENYHTTSWFSLLWGWSCRLPVTGEAKKEKAWVSVDPVLMSFHCQLHTAESPWEEGGLVWVSRLACGHVWVIAPWLLLSSLRAVPPWPGGPGLHKKTSWAWAGGSKPECRPASSLPPWFLLQPPAPASCP